MSRTSIALVASFLVAACYRAAPAEDPLGPVVDPGPTPDPGPAPDPVGPIDPPPAPTGGAILDCDVEAGYETSSYVAPTSGSPELWVFGVYETSSGHARGEHPTGEATVRVDRTAPLVLVLSSYEPTHWTVTAAPGADLRGVVLDGYYEQTATVPDGVPVTDVSGVGRYLAACAYVWPSDDQGCDTPGLVAGAEALTGLTLTAFYGCNTASQFVVTAGELAPVLPRDTPAAQGDILDCNVDAGYEVHRIAGTSAGEPELHAFGVYETGVERGFQEHVRGEATVAVDTGVRVMLLLSSYEATHWTVSQTERSAIDLVIVNGYYEQTVTLPDGVPAMSFDYDSGGDVLGNGDAYGEDSGGGDTPGLMADAEAVAGVPVASFTGCYEASTFSLHDREDPAE